MKEERLQLPAGTKLRTLSFGCPPIFTSPHLACMDNILDVLHHNDGISGISLRGLSTLHQRKRGLANLKLHRRTLLRMALGKKNKTDGEGDQLTLREEQDLQQLDDERSLGGDGETTGSCEHKERGIYEAAQDGLDSNENRTHAEKESHKLVKEEKEEEGDEVDGERGRRPSLLEQMIIKSFNVGDPQHPSQPPILPSHAMSPRSKPDPANSEEEEKKRDEMGVEEDSGSGRRQSSSLGESLLASIASLRSEPVTPGLSFEKEKSIPIKSLVYMYLMSFLPRSLVQG